MVGKVRNGHRRFALPKQLNETGSQFGHGLFEIFHQHGGAAVNKGFQGTKIIAIERRTLDHHPHHGGSDEHVGHAAFLYDPEGQFRVE